MNFLWQKKSLFTQTQLWYAGALYPILVVFITLLANYFFDWKLPWDLISPIEVGILPRSFLSVLGFLTFGAFLYWIKFYRFLYKISGSYRDFKDAKKIVWGIVILIIFGIVQAIIFAVNKIAELFYNWLNILIYLSPGIGITTTLYLIILVGYLRYQKKDSNVIFKK